jgi:hypothetical protein
VLGFGAAWCVLSAALVLAVPAVRQVRSGPAGQVPSGPVGQVTE